MPFGRLIIDLFRQLDSPECRFQRLRSNRRRVRRVVGDRYLEIANLGPIAPKVNTRARIEYIICSVSIW
jgi:hypothetical protein